MRGYANVEMFSVSNNWIKRFSPTEYIWTLKAIKYERRNKRKLASLMTKQEF